MIKVLCCGNQYVCDDGLGYYVYRALSDGELPDRVVVRYVGVMGIALLECFEREEKVVIVDAIRLGKQPGTVYRLAMDDFDSVTQPGVACTHELGIFDIINIGQMVYPAIMPREIVFYGVEPRLVGQYGVGLSPEVRTSVQELVDQIVHECSTSVQLTF